MKKTNAAIFSPLFLYLLDDFNRLNINEIADALGEKLRSFETITKKEHDEFRKRMKEHLLNSKKY